MDLPDRQVGAPLMGERVEPSYWAASGAEADMNLHVNAQKVAGILPHGWIVVHLVMQADLRKKQSLDMVNEDRLAAAPMEEDCHASVLRGPHLVGGEILADLPARIRTQAGKDAVGQTGIPGKILTLLVL